jgi:hypothetical protein
VRSERDERFYKGHVSIETVTAGRLHHPPREPEAFRALATRVESLLNERGLSHDALEALTRDGLRGDRRLRIPGGFVSGIRSGRVPRVHHVLALSEVAGIGLYTCFAAFGYDLEDIPILQAALHRERTIPLPATIYDGARLVEWPTLADEHVDGRRGEFLSELAQRFEGQCAATLAAARPASFEYFRIGLRDRHLVPAVVPGTIVGVDRTETGPTADAGTRQDPWGRPVYMVAHIRGLTCTYVDWLDDRTIALVPCEHAGTPSVYQLGGEATVVGRVRTELRPLRVAASDVARAGHDHCARRLVHPDPEHLTLGRFLRSARERIGMTHREAHEMSLEVADAYGNRRYAIGVGTLSDWESQRELPLNIPHVVSLAVCYAVPFGQLLRAGRLVDRDPFAITYDTGPRIDTHPLLDDASALPPALIHAARIASSLPNLSWSDVFRCGAGSPALDRSLVGARFVIVNRRDRRFPRPSESSTIDRPLCILGDSRGRQICTGCFARNGHVYLQPDPVLPVKVRRLPRAHVSVRGRALAVLRLR